MHLLRSQIRLIVVAIVMIVVSTFVGRRAVAQRDEARPIPPPAMDEASSTAASEVVVLAGGCFWGVQGVYQHLKGVTNALSGYAGGSQSAAHYDIVSRGDTGHAESVQVTFDPRQVTYGKILQVFFSVVHDPTQLNRQGPDVGTQYRSAIFPGNDEQAKIARAYIAQLDQARVFDVVIVTKIEMGRTFYAAEAYHQDYLKRNPSNPYIVYNDLPKIADLKKFFPGLFLNAPVLVNGTR
jgi:peptide-methionine (S)-S-oxide reductase